MPSIYDWSTTPATNSAADSAINMAEFMNPDLVNDGIRQLMARVAEWRKDLGATIATGGSGNAYTLTTSSPITAYVDGFTIWFTADRANGGSSTLAVNGLAAIPLRGKSGTALPANSMLANAVYGAVYKNATSEFILVGSNAGLQELAPALMSAQVFGLRVGSPVLSIAPTADAGFLRLTETTQSVVKADYPELNAVVSGWGYPWGSTSTTFNLPPAAGYFPRFAATSSAIDTSGARTAGSTQTDQNKAHTHDKGTLASNVSLSGITADIHGGAASISGQSGADFTTRSVATLGSLSLTNGAITGSTASSGGDEVRVKNVALHLDILAKPALVATELIGAHGLAMRYSATTTDADPGAGYFRFNHATFASITQLFLSETDYFGTSIAALIQSWDDVGTSSRGTVRFVKIGAPTTWAEFRVNGAITDGGSYDKVPVAPVSTAGTWTEADKSHVIFSPAGEGPAGTAGASGPNIGLDYIWSTATSGDPGSGKVLVNHATPSSATQLNISETNRLSASQATYIATWDDSTNTADRGTLRIVDVASPGANFLEYSISGAMTDAGGYDTFPVTYVGGAGTIANNTTIAVAFFRAGNKGLDGAGSGDVVGPASATDNALARFDTTTGKLLQNSAVTADDSGNMGGVVTIELGHASDTTLSRSAAGRLAVEGKDAILKGQTDTLTSGYSATPYNAGTRSSGTYTPDEANGNLQYATNGGAHTLAPPTNNCTIIVQYTNNASAGAITTSGFTKVSGTAPGTVNGDDFLGYITKHNGFSHLTWVALQ